MKKISKLFVVVISLFILNCTTAPITGRTQLKFISDEELATSSSSEYKNFISAARSKGLIDSSSSNATRLSSIGRKVSSAVEQFMYQNNMGNKVKYLNWEFNVIKSNEVNAFALPGGKIAFYSGIFPILKTDAAIAFVMGHEIGHIVGGHHAEGQSQKTAAGLTALVTNIFVGSTASSLVSDGLSLSLLKFNRTQEYEADKYGMIFMAMAGYNPEEAIKAQERMATLSNDGSDFLSTHPRSGKRIEEMRNFLPQAVKYYKK